MNIVQFFFLVLFLLFAQYLFSQNEILDISFGLEGVVMTDFSAASDNISALEEQKNGKILAFGSIIKNSDSSSFGLTRYNVDGTLDNSFGQEGKIVTSFENAKAYGQSVHILTTENKILVSGKIDFINDKVDRGSAIAIVKYNSDGSLDETFGVGGKVITDFDNTSETGTIIATQRDGKFLLVGGINSPIPNSVFVNSDALLIRYNSDGSIDKGFGIEGIVKIDFGSETESLGVGSIQPNGKIIVAGTILRNGTKDIILARFNENGELDSSFGTEGRVFIDLGNEFSNEIVNDLLLQLDGKILLGGKSFSNTKGDFLLIRLNSDGTYDKTFSDDGVVKTKITKTDNIVFQSDDVVKTILLQPDSKIIAIGNTSTTSVFNLNQVLVRYHANGTIDQGFGNSGKLILDFAENSTTSNASLYQSGGKIVIGGSIWTGNYKDRNFFLNRYLIDFKVGMLDLFTNTDYISIYPNPTESVATLEYTLETPEILTIQLTDLNGRILKTYLQNQPQPVGDYQQMIDLPTDLPRGMYFVRLASPNGQMVVKVMK